MKSKILDLLYNKFFADTSSPSNVTSSHWKNHELHKVKKTPIGGYKLSGNGFGDFQSRTALNIMRSAAVYRELKKLAYIHNCDPTLWIIGNEIAKIQGRTFSYDCLKQVLSLSRILSVLKKDDCPDTRGLLTSLGINRVCVIGDGYGYLTSLLKAVDPGVLITSVNLGRGLFFDVYYTLLAHPNKNIELVEDFVGQIDLQSDFCFLPAENYEELSKVPQDLVLNIAGMQEMDITVVNNYLKYIRPKIEAKSVLFYCCNRREKRLPAGEVIRFSDYGWLEADRILFAEPCPWYQKFPTGVIPYYLQFDGEVLHKFALMAPNEHSYSNQR